MCSILVNGNLIDFYFTDELFVTALVYSMILFYTINWFCEKDIIVLW